MKTKLLFYILILLIFSGCSQREKELSEAEKKILYLAGQTVQLINDIEKFETYYSYNKGSSNWKKYYDQKRERLDSLNRELNNIIQETRFFERMPEDNTKRLASDLLHACENVKLYLNTTNADLSNYYKTPPPAYDPYNWDRLIVPAKNKLETIISKNKTTINSKKIKGTHYQLSQPGQDDVNRQIQSSPQKMEEWKEDVESAMKKIPENNIKK